MAVIPGTSNVIVWDYTGVNLPLGVPASPNGPQWIQRFSVGNPETGVFTNYVINMPAGYGDLFCSGHCWLPDGRLFVAGGNTLYPYAPPPPPTPPLVAPHFEGSRFVGFWNPAHFNTPPHYGWDFSLLTTFTPPRAMNKRRWYPTVTLISDHLVMVSGGSEDTRLSYCQGQLDGAFNTYEVFDLAANNWELDPANRPRLHNGPMGSPLCNQVLGQYPRLHLVSTNHIFLSGEWNGTSRVDHVSSNPIQMWLLPVNSGSFRGSGSSVLVPNVGNTTLGRDELMIIGGGVSGQPSNNTSRRIDAGATNPVWGAPQVMQAGRMTANAVLTPNGDIVVIGGSSDFYFAGPNPVPVLTTEVWDKTSGWRPDAAQISPRMYHSTAALLPSGRIVAAGGDIRTLDWEIYEPRNMANGQTIPQFQHAWSAPGIMNVTWGTDYVIPHAPLPVGVAISRVVLMRPCSTTHHSDMDQRYVELETIPPQPGVIVLPNSITVRMPAAPNWAGTLQGSVTTPPGCYMAFLVTTQGTPSQAKWIRLQ